MKNSKYPIIWLTGQPGSGKTTLSNELLKIISNFQDKINVIQIDGDDLRHLTDNKDYSKEGRYSNIRLGQNIALFSQNKGSLVIVSLVAPYLDLREELKQKTIAGEFYIYTEKIRGREHFSKDYQKPEHNFFPIDTTVKTVKESADEIFAIYERWQPWHNGHKWLIDQRLKEGKNVCIGIRDVIADEKNPFSPQEVESNVMKN